MLMELISLSELIVTQLLLVWGKKKNMGGGVLFSLVKTKNITKKQTQNFKTTKNFWYTLFIYPAHW